MVLERNVMHSWRRRSSERWGVPWRAHHHVPERVRQPHLHHVALDGLAVPHARVIALRHDVREALLDGDLDLDARVASAERR